MRLTLLGLALLLAAPAPAQKIDPNALFKGLRFREIGPANMGGRVDDFAVVDSNPSTIYVGFASAGVWKTVNNGTTWTPIFDNEAVSTIGDLALAPSDPSILYVGTGESNNRQSSSWGNGVYKSTDAGRTWKHLGLAETHHIGRIVVHPTNPDIVYVAATGRLWGPSKERGVYKTTDGGKTWQLVLFVNEDTGATDIAIDHESPGIVYAALYQRRRTVFGFNGSGPHSALYRSTDGGATWNKVTRGLPEATETGRIGLAVWRRNSSIVYCLVEHKSGGIYRSEDKGESWTKMSDTNPRPMYYSQVIIDPNNDQRIWVLGAPLYYSEDGGRTFRQNLAQRLHTDFHALWINPANSDHMVMGSDAGLQYSYDRGRSWDYANTLALGQFYEIGLGMEKPYRICGGLQDNGTWCGPSRSLDSRGIGNDDWATVNGGDGFFAQIDPQDSNIIYAESQDGNISRRDLRTHESKSIRPREKEGEARFRFQWSTPIWISQHDNKTIYYPGNFLFRSRDRGDNWEKASPDLTNNQERDKLPIMGKVPDADTLSRHDGVQQWPTSTTFSESALNKNILWTGTDDGNVHVTRNGGLDWKNLAAKIPNLPKGTYVSRIVASRACEGCALATFDGHRMNDFNIYVYETKDFGESWKDISSGLPRNNGIINVVREHARATSLLFAGGEYGLYVSFDRGQNWSEMKLNLPRVPVDDIQIHPRDNDLVLATHGRSIWILDDITAFEKMSQDVMNGALTAFTPVTAINWRTRSTRGSTGDRLFFGSNPPAGALLSWHLKTKLVERERVRITVKDAEGKTVRELTAAGEPGVQRMNWDLRMAPATQPAPEQLQALQSMGIDVEQFGGGRGGRGGGGGGGGAAASAAAAAGGQAGGAGIAAAFAGGFGGGGGGFGGAPAVEPGEYTVEIRAGSATASTKVTVEEDPRIQISPEDRRARRELITKVYQLQQQMDRAGRNVRRYQTQLQTLTDGWKRPGTPQPPAIVKEVAEKVSKQVEEVFKMYATAQGRGAQAMGSAGPPLTYTPPPIPQRLSRLVSALGSVTAAPSKAQIEEFDELAKLAEKAMNDAKPLDAEIQNLEKAMRDANLPYLRDLAPATPTVGRRG